MPQDPNAPDADCSDSNLARLETGLAETVMPHPKFIPSSCIWPSWIFVFIDGGMPPRIRWESVTLGSCLVSPTWNPGHRVVAAPLPSSCPHRPAGALSISSKGGNVETRLCQIRQGSGVYTELYEHKRLKVCPCGPDSCHAWALSGTVLPP